jgi:hypothetical protein
VVTVSAEEFEQLVRRELAARDKQRRARLMDPANYEQADSAFVAAVMTAAGFAVPADAEKAPATGSRSRRKGA